MDYTAFRTSAVRGEAVSVNHKALIKRTLTKYPIDYAVFRELLQNSADAQATSATIQFETSEPTFNVARLHGAPITRLRFTNNGQDFATADWRRLREIASGNPNEAKIGAFGVGFYSVFDLTDEPLVHSGKSVMNFRFHNDVQLHFYFSENVADYQKGTLIDLPYHTVRKLDDLVKFIGFLVQSFLLVNLDNIDLQLKYANGEVVDLLSLQKQHQNMSSMPVPPGLVATTPNKTLKMSSLQKSDLKISLKYMNITQQPPLSISQGWFSLGKQLVSALTTESAEPTAYTTTTCNLIKVDCSADVNVSNSFRNKMVETILKPPPKQAVLSLISFSEGSDAETSGQLKSYVLPKDFNDAKIFVGFPTKQSTGLRSHLALNQLIPTMERTDIDMSNSFVKDWNTEMLYMAGILARCTYEYELRQVQKLGSGHETASKAALSICARFEFGESAPEKLIGIFIRAGFWNCTKQTLVPTSRGILPNSDARLPRDATQFLRVTPVVTDSQLAKQLKSVGLIHSITNIEIVKDVGSSPLDSERAVQYIRWLVRSWNTFSDAEKVAFVSTLKVTEANQSIYDFNEIRFYLDRSKLPDEDVSMHLPPNCLTSELGNLLGHLNLITMGIQPLDLHSWSVFRFKSLEDNSNPTKEFASVLQVISRTWNRLPTKSRSQMRNLLSQTKCIPTQVGLHYPHESYIKEMKLFPQLPVVLTSANLPDNWLLEIGLRASMDMSLVLNALSGSTLKWTNEDLLQYLEGNVGSLKSSDWTTLREGKFFARKGSFSTLYRARDLYPPSNQLERLGLPTINLKNWSEQSLQARILLKIGLKLYPTPHALFSSLENTTKYELALSYFIDNYEKAHYNSQWLESVAVIPLESSTQHVKPYQCYSDPSVSLFGLPVIKRSLAKDAEKLGVRKSPSVSSLLDLVLKAPQKYLSNQGRCEKIMVFFAQHAGELNDEDIQQCKETAFIPVRRGEKIEWLRPSSVFLPSTAESEGEDILRPLLRTIYPSRLSLPFFKILGISDRLTVTQLVRQLISQPAAVLNLCPSIENYEALLYEIEARWVTWSKSRNLVAAMRSSAFLLGRKYLPNEEMPEVSLYRVDQLVIVDDVVIFNQFRDQIVVCPPDDLLEKLYARLGVPKLSEILREKVSLGAIIADNEPLRASLEDRVNERLELHKKNTTKEMKRFGHIGVELISRIELQRQLFSRASAKVLTSACMHPTKPEILLVAPYPSYDWIDIANALAKTVLLKPNQDSVIVLEVQLSSDLNSLEKKGYDVQRIRRKAQAKVVKPLIEDPPDVEPHTAVAPKQESPRFTAGQQQPSGMPGQFPGLKSLPQVDSPVSKADIAPKSLSKPHTPRVPGIPSQGQPNNGIFSSLKSLVLGSTPSQGQSGHPSALGQSGQSGLLGQRGSDPAGLAGQSMLHNQPGRPNSPNPPQSPVNVSQALRKGVSSGRAFSGSSLAAPTHIDPPPTLSNTSMCSNPKSIGELRHISNLDSGVKVYTTVGGHHRPLQDEEVLGHTLLVLSDIFGYPRDAMHIYRQENTNTLAFNYNGSIFVNSSKQIDVASPLDYYYPIVAHELAHNLVSDHGAQHSFYEEAYIQHSLDGFRKYT